MVQVAPPSKQICEWQELTVQEECTPLGTMSQGSTKDGLQIEGVKQTLDEEEELPEQ